MFAIIKEFDEIAKDKKDKQQKEQEVDVDHDEDQYLVGNRKICGQEDLPV